MRRDTVKPNLQVLLPLIKEKFRSNVVFTKEVRGKDKSGWISEWRRGKNFPSPEEAARMCILLETTPEEILLHEGETDEETAKCLEDIQRVKELVAELRKEEPVLIGASLPITREAWEAAAEKWSDEDLLKAMRKLLAIQEERREKNGD